MTITLPWPPSVNHYYRRVGAKTLISAEGREYRRWVRDCVLAERAAHGMTARLEVLITVYPPDRRRRDLDNLTKSLLDALQHAGVYCDDAQIDVLTIQRGGVWAAHGGQVVVAIEEIADINKEG